MGAAHGKKKEYSLQSKCPNGSRNPGSGGSASMYTEIQREQPDSGNILNQPDYIDGNPDLIKPKKLLNPVKASKSHQELHRELLMNHKRGLSMESKPELQRVLEHRRRNQLIRQKKEEEEAKKLQSPFEKELLKRHQRLDQLEKEQEKQEDHAPEFIKVKENLRRTSTVTGNEKAA
uniref:Actin-associated protein FAM107A n=1 Tax=Otus sunia TaxID=257818 RepID=A0A8C8AG73_9STRI